jgi:signal transduction histidine kinase
VLAEELLEAREAQTHGLAVEVELGAALVAGDEALLERLLANLLDNAIVHNAADVGWISVKTATRGGQASLRVANGGAQIPADRVTELFEPFRRLGDERAACAEGLGLGLSIVSAIASAHGATLSARTLTPGGLELVVSFPALDALASSAPISRAPAANLAQMQG